MVKEMRDTDESQGRVGLERGVTVQRIQREQLEKSAGCWVAG